MFKACVEQNLKKKRIEENSCSANCSNDVGFNDVRELYDPSVVYVQFCNVGAVHLSILSMVLNYLKVYLFLEIKKGSFNFKSLIRMI